MNKRYQLLIVFVLGTLSLPDGFVVAGDARPVRPGSIPAAPYRPMPIQIRGTIAPTVSAGRDRIGITQRSSTSTFLSASIPHRVDGSKTGTRMMESGAQVVRPQSPAGVTYVDKTFPFGQELHTVRVPSRPDGIANLNSPKRAWGSFRKGPDIVRGK